MKNVLTLLILALMNVSAAAHTDPEDFAFGHPD